MNASVHSNARLVIFAIVTVLLPLRMWGNGNESANVRLVTTGQIRKINPRNKTFDFRIVLDGFPVRVSGGRSGARGRYPGRGYPPGVRLVPVIDIKVVTSEKTRYKSSAGTIDFSSLRVADRISLTAIHKGGGTDVEALEIDKN